MRVLMLSKACIVGMYQRKLEEMARYPEIELEVLVPPSWRDERGITRLEYAHTNGYQLTVTPIRLNGSFHLHYYPEFGRHVRRFQPDIIHIDEEPYNVATWLALRAARRQQAKTLFFSWQNILRNYPFPFSWMERAALSTVDHAIVGTQSAAEVWHQKGYDGPLSVIPQFGVDPDIFYPPNNKSVQSPTIAYIGRLVAEKGIDVFLSALGELKSLEWQGKIIGDGPERQQLKQLAQQLGLTRRLEFIQWLPSVEMPDTYRQLDLLVVPSRTRSNWKEQFGRVLTEAMASEVAVIGSDSGAIPDVIGEGGLVFPEDNMVALAQRLRQLLENPDQRRELGQQGRQRVLKHFTQQQVAASTINVYREILAV
jgi:glycosyltransferase involved in cell wall biosynthesis